MNTYSFNFISTIRAKTVASEPISDRWCVLDFAELGVLKVDFQRDGVVLLDREADFEIVGKPLAYPNPFRQAEGTEIGCELSRNMDIEIHIYNMFGHLIEKIYAPEGDVGGTEGFNRVAFG